VTALRLAAIGVLAAAGVIAALLAADVRAWPVALENGDAVFAIAPGAPGGSLRRISATLQRAVGDRRRRRARLALQGYRQAADLQQQLGNAFPVPTQRLAAISALSDPASSANPQVARRRGRCSGS